MGLVLGTGGLLRHREEDFPQFSSHGELGQRAWGFSAPRLGSTGVYETQVGWTENSSVRSGSRNFTGIDCPFYIPGAWDATLLVNF
jgi:hypothetical protein